MIQSDFHRSISPESVRLAYRYFKHHFSPDGTLSPARVTGQPRDRPLLADTDLGDQVLPIRREHPIRLRGANHLDSPLFCTWLMEVVQSQYSKPGGESNPVWGWVLLSMATTECGGIVAGGPDANARIPRIHQRRARLRYPAQQILQQQCDEPN